MDDSRSPYEIAKAAAAGEKKAIEFLIDRYSDYIDELCNGDEDMRQEIIAGYIETLKSADIDAIFSAESKSKID